MWQTEIYWFQSEMGCFELSLLSFSFILDVSYSLLLQKFIFPASECAYLQVLLRNCHCGLVKCLQDGFPFCIVLPVKPELCFSIVWTGNIAPISSVALSLQPFLTFFSYSVYICFYSLKQYDMLQEYMGKSI